jgi:site-specific DNA recombinase
VKNTLLERENQESSPLKKCAVYTRVSTDEQAAKEQNSCETQAVLCTELIERNRRDGWIWTETLTDAGYSGGNLNRPGIRKLIELVKRRQIDIVAVYRRDRLFRDTNDSNDLQKFFDLHDVLVASVVEGIHDRSPHARFARQMIDAMSEMERLTIIGRVRDAVRHRASLGQWKAGCPPLGYNYTAGTFILTINEEEAAIVRFIFGSIAAGMSTAELVRELRDRHMYPRGRYVKKTEKSSTSLRNFFAVDDILRIVRNQNYRGYVRARNPDCSGNKPKDSPDAWILFKGLHEPLVDDDTWFRANRNFDKRGVQTRFRHTSSAPVTFLGGLARCGDCHCAMCGMSSTHPNRQKYRGHRYLRCSQHAKAGEHSPCTTRSISADAVEVATLAIIQELATNPDAIVRLSHGVSQDRTQTLRAELAELDGELRKHRDVVKNLVEYVKKGDIESIQGECVHALQEENRRCEEVSARRALVEQRLFEAGAKLASPSEVTEAFRRVSVALVAADVKTRNEIVRRVFESLGIQRRDELFFPGKKRAAGRSYRFILRVKTGALLSFGSSELSSRTEFRRYAPLAFSFTIRIDSNRERQTVSILETSVVVESSKFTLPERKPAQLQTTAVKNPIQRALRWQAMLSESEGGLEALAKSEEVSKALISQHKALLHLPQKILMYFRDGRDAELKLPFTFRELQRMAELEPAAAEEYFARRLSAPSQAGLKFE